MRFTQWGEYGIHCSAFVAKETAGTSGTVGAAEIAEAQGIAIDYVHQILHRLRKGGIVDSVRGPQGGYKLARPADQITLGDVLKASEGDTFEVICESKPIDNERCNTGAWCGLRVIWHDLKEHIDTFFVRYTLKDLIEKYSLGTSFSQSVQLPTGAKNSEPSVRSE